MASVQVGFRVALAALVLLHVHLSGEHALDIVGLLGISHPVAPLASLPNFDPAPQP